MRTTRPSARRLRERQGVSSCERLSEALRQPRHGRVPLTFRANRTRFVPSKCKHLGCKRIAVGRWRSGLGTRFPCKSLVGAPGFEPGTSSLSEKRSNRLSYAPTGDLESKRAAAGGQPAIRCEVGGPCRILKP